MLLSILKYSCFILTACLGSVRGRAVICINNCHILLVPQNTTLSDGWSCDLHLALHGKSHRCEGHIPRNAFTAAKRPTNEQPFCGIGGDGGKVTESQLFLLVKAEAAAGSVRFALVIAVAVRFVVIMSARSRLFICRGCRLQQRKLWGGSFKYEYSRYMNKLGNS